MISKGPDDTKAKHIFEEARAECKIVPMDSGLQGAIKNLTGEDTQVNVFVGGKHVAGWEDLKMMAEQGTLRKELNNAGVKHDLRFY